MSEHIIDRPQGQQIFCKSEGEGAPLVLLHGLGTHMGIWDGLLPHFPPNVRIIKCDIRGHGRSSAPDAPYSMGQLISDIEAALDHLRVQDAVVLGTSIGGMIAQGLAVKRLDLVRGLVLSNTAAKIGNADHWQDQIDAYRAHGLRNSADNILQKWFSRDYAMFNQTRIFRQMLLSTPLEGYLGCCHAIKGTDFYTPTSGLRLPTLGIAGSEDQVTPPDLVRETLDVIPGSKFHLMRRVGHLPCVEAPEAYAEVITQFLKNIGHI